MKIEEDSVKPEVKKVEYEDGVITVTFTEDVDEDTAEDLDNYVVVDPDGDEADISDATRDATDKDEVELTFRDAVADLDEGTYKITISDVEDESGNKISKVTKEFTVDDSTNPDFPGTVYYEAPGAGDRIKLYVEFGDKMATSGTYSALDLTKYKLTLDAAGTPTAVDLGDEDNIDDYDIDIAGIDGNKTVKITLDATIRLRCDGRRLRCNTNFHPGSRC